MKHKKMPYIPIPVIALFWILLALFFILTLPGKGETSIIEIPIRQEKEALRRVPGDFQFYYLGWIAGSGRMVAIPEDEIGRFIKLAEDLEFDPIGGLSSVVSNVKTIKIEIIHQNQLAFWIDEGAYWISWDDQAPPEFLVDGAQIVFYANPPFPRSPILMEVKK